MAKKKSVLGKLVALTTTAAAIGGVCYVFRDKIKESSVYHAAVNGLSSFMGKHDKYSDDDDFMFDDDDFIDAFDETAGGREYTSITINSKETDAAPEAEEVKEETKEETKEDTKEEAKEEPKEEAKEEVKKETKEEPKKEDAKEATEKKTDDDSISVLGASIPAAFNTATTNENDWISNDDDDPDTLAEQDKLDF